MSWPVFPLRKFPWCNIGPVRRREGWGNIMLIIKSRTYHQGDKFKGICKSLIAINGILWATSDSCGVIKPSPLTEDIFPPAAIYAVGWSLGLIGRSANVLSYAWKVFADSFHDVKSIVIRRKSFDAIVFCIYLEISSTKCNTTFFPNT